MKLLLDHPSTLEHLKQWAGEKQLVFAHFFFWGSGYKMQRSLVGLYRSILFETLKQCPDLIRDILPDAYDTFSKKGPGSTIDKLFFRPEDLARGMKTLMSRSQYLGYRFCLFIDGLDEYGEDGTDGLHHEELAEDLESWAANEDIKILVSSRPHREFQQTFSDSRRIKLHELTKPDIWNFGQTMFKEDKNFPSIQQCYKELISNVVDSSYGVFLWARLAFRSLIMATRRSIAMDYLKKQLDGIPKDINKLYENLLGSINPADREITFKMLLLVSELGSVNPIAWTWLEQLDDPNFPTLYNIHPYSDDDIAERQETAASQVGDFTKGLLEITEHHTDDSNPFFDRKIQFFHRTLQDFVRKSEQLRKFSTEYPEFLGHDIKFRLALAEYWFAKSEYICHNFTTRYRFNDHPIDQTRDARLDAVEKVSCYHIAAGCKRMTGGCTHPSLGFPGIIFRKDDATWSFLHWVIFDLDDTEYICRRLAKDPRLFQTQDDLSFIVSTFFSLTKDCAMLKTLLSLGLSPNEPVRVLGGELPVFNSVWAIFCVFFATGMLCNKPIIDDWKTLWCKRLELFLAARVVNSDCLILLARRYNSTSGPTHAISLRQLVVQLEPINQVAILQLMNGSGKGIMTTLKAAWRYLAPVNLTPPPSTAALLPVDASMQFSELARGKEAFIVHSVKWGDGTQIFTKDLRVRLF